VVRRDGQEIRLTRIEYDLLAVMVRNQGRLLTHRALLAAHTESGIGFRFDPR